MPKPGQKTITIPEKVYNIAWKHAFDEHKSVAAWVTEIIMEKVKAKERKSN